MIYLVGISDHNIQHNGNNCVDLSIRSNFSVFLKDRIKEYNINLVAEEFNEDALYKISRGDAATVKSVAEGLKIEHRFCEPSIDERRIKNILSPSEILNKKLNIKIERELNENEQKIFDEEKVKSFLAREAIWFEKISDYLDKNMIFICATEHIKSFETLLTSKRYKPIILVDNWKK